MYLLNAFSTSASQLKNGISYDMKKQKEIMSIVLSSGI